MLQVVQSRLSLSLQAVHTRTGRLPGFDGLSWQLRSLSFALLSHWWWSTSSIPACTAKSPLLHTTTRALPQFHRRCQVTAATTWYDSARTSSCTWRRVARCVGWEPPEGSSAPRELWGGAERLATHLQCHQRQEGRQESNAEAVLHLSGACPLHCCRRLAFGKKKVTG